MMPVELPESWRDRIVKPAAPVATTQASFKPCTPGGSPYVRAVVDRELEKLRTTTENRNTAANTVALKFAHYHAAGEIPDMREEIFAACVANGLVADPEDGESKTRKSIESGWSAGLKDPRFAPPRGGHTPATTKTAPVSDITTGTPWPDPEPLCNGLPAVPAFIPELLPISLRPWILDIAERLQCPVEYVAVAALSSLGSLIGRQCAVRPKRHDDWAVVPNLWAVLVGLPSAMKSPAMEEASRPLLRLEVEAAEAFAKQTQDIEARKAMAKARKAAIESKMLRAAKAGTGDDAVLMDEFSAAVDADEITQRRYSTSDVTIEKLGELLIENRNGLLLKCDELRGVLNSLDRDGHESARAFYLTAHDGTHGYTQDRIARGSKFIPAVCVTILGCIQPGPLAQYLLAAIRGGAGDDGFMQRFQLGVYPDVCREWRLVDRWPNKEARDRAFDVFKQLANLSPSMVGATGEDGELPYLRFDGPAQTLFDGWLSDLMNRLRAGGEHPTVEAHLAKYSKLMPALALVSHLADAGQGAIALASAQRAAAWCDLLEAHARRIYASVAAERVRAAGLLLAKIKSGKLIAPFTARDIYRASWAGLDDREVVEEALATLTDHGWVRSLTRGTASRPATEYLVHPSVLAHSVDLSVLSVPQPENTQLFDAATDSTRARAITAQKEGM
jgi:putative DNA primase/helicase